MVLDAEPVHEEIMPSLWGPRGVSNASRLKRCYKAKQRARGKQRLDCSISSTAMAKLKTLQLNFDQNIGVVVERLIRTRQNTRRNFRESLNHRLNEIMNIGVDS